jgi:hypothetical protein
MSTFSKQEKLASDLLQRKGIFIIHKATRAGASFTITKIALEKGLKVVVLTPTKRILRNLQEKLPSLLGYSPRMIMVGPNSELCQKLDKKLGRKLVFQFKENCDRCEFNGKPSQCCYQNLRMNDFNLFCLTYDKLQALVQYQSKDTTMIIDKLLAADVLILDESTTAILSDVQTIELIYDYNGLAKKMSDDIEALLPKKAMWADILRTFLKHFENVKENGILENNVWNTVLLPEKARQDFFVDGWLYITGRTKRGLDTKYLQRIFLSMFAKKVVITVDNGKISLTPMVEDALAYLKTFVSKFGKDKTVFVVDSYQPSVNFQSLFGTEVTHVNWGDPLNTNAKQLIIADTAHWGAKDFAKDPKLRTKIQQTSEHVLTQFLPEQVIIVTTNKSMATEIYSWHLPEAVMIKWFRSDWMRGVQAENRRVMVCVGGPYLPKKAYTDSSKSFNIKDFVVEMDSLLTNEQKAPRIPYLFRFDDTRSEFKNAIGRVKDPEGKERSVVITLGMQGHEVKALLRDNSPFPLPKPYVTQTMFGGGMSDEGLTIAKLWFDNVEVEQPRHLAILARIICHSMQKGSISSSQVIVGQTQLVKDIALKYQSILQKYGVKVTFKQGGISFEKA